MNLILFILGVIGLTHILVDSEIMGPIHEWIEPRCPIVGKIMECYQCCGFWCGLLLAPLLSYNPLIWFAAGCAGSFLASLGFWILEALEVWTKRK